MAEYYAESELSVEVQGEEAVNRLNEALQRLAGQAASVQRTVTAAGSAAAAKAGVSEVEDVTRRSQQEAGSLVQRISNTFSRGIRGAFTGPLDAVKAAAGVAGRSLRSFAGPLGEIAGKAGAGGTAILAFTAVVAGIAGPILSLVAGFKLLRSSFGWAQEAAESQLKLAAQTRRFFPAAVGEAFGAAADEMEVRMGLATQVFGQGAEQMQESITRRFTEYRLGRGLRGETDIFARWGITPQAMQRFEQMSGGRHDLQAWLKLWVVNREQLEQQLQAAQTPQERQRIERRLAMLADDTTKMFGRQFSDMVLRLNSTDIVRMESNLRRATALAAPADREQAIQNAKDFQISLAGLKDTFQALKMGIGNDVRPTITTFLEAINEKILQVDEQGRSVGTSLRGLASALANKAWETLERLLAKIDVTKINDWIATINTWSAEDTAKRIEDIFTGLWDLGKSLARLTTSIMAFWEALPPFLKNPGVIAGAVTGAAAGSVIPGVGTLAGAVTGAVVGGASWSAAEASEAQREAARATTEAPAAPVTPTPEAPSRGWGSAIGSAIGDTVKKVGNWLNPIQSARAGELTPEQREILRPQMPTGAAEPPAAATAGEQPMPPRAAPPPNVAPAMGGRGGEGYGQAALFRGGGEYNPAGYVATVEEGAISTIERVLRERQDAAAATQTAIAAATTQDLTAPVAPVVTPSPEVAAVAAAVVADKDDQRKGIFDSVTEAAQSAVTGIRDFVGRLSGAARTPETPEPVEAAPTPPPEAALAPGLQTRLEEQQSAFEQFARMSQQPEVQMAVAEQVPVPETLAVVTPAPQSPAEETQERKSFIGRVGDLARSTAESAKAALNLRNFAERFGQAVEQAPEEARTEAQPAPGPPPPPPIEPAPGPPPPVTPAPEPERPGLWGRIKGVGQGIMQRHRAGWSDVPSSQAQPVSMMTTAGGGFAIPGEPVVAPRGPVAPEASQAAVEALKGAAVGRAVSVIADVQEGSGANLVMRSERFGAVEGRRQAAEYDPYNDTSETRNKVRQVLAPWLRKNFGVTLRGTEGTPPGETPSTVAADFTAPPTAAGLGDGMGAEEGTIFGQAAGQAVREKLETIDLSWGGGSTSFKGSVAEQPWTGTSTPTDI